MLWLNPFRINYIFKKPSRNKVLLYDGVTKEHMNLLVKKYTIFYNRYEEINLYVLFYTILKDGLKEIKKNYKINFFKFVSPKLIITFIDINLGFYKLKDIYSSCKYLSIEFLTKKNLKTSKDNKLISTDFISLLGKNSVEYKKKDIIGKFFIGGNVNNNHFYLKKKNKLEEKKNYLSKNLLYINTFKYEKLIYLIKEHKFASNSLVSLKKTALHFIKTFNILCKVADLNNYNLTFLSKDNINYEKNFRSIFPQKNWNYLANNAKFSNSYEQINSAFLIITDHSTLGFEALSKKKRTIFIPSKETIKRGFKNTIWNNNLICIKNPTFANISLRINNLQNIKNSAWNKKIKSFYNSTVVYNPGNIFLKKKIKNFLTN